jgi:hypothetical protein
MTEGQRGGGMAGQREIMSALSSLAFARDDIARPLPHAAAPPTCLRCNFPVPVRAMGCKNPCPNCGTLYPLGDCSD